MDLVANRPSAKLPELQCLWGFQKGLPSLPVGTLTMEELVQDAGDVWRRICNRANTVSTAVFITRHGLEFCKAGGRDQATYITHFGEGFLGIYNARIRIDHFIEDALAAARQMGILQEDEGSNDPETTPGAPLVATVTRR